MPEVPNDNHDDTANEQRPETQPGHEPLQDDATLGDFSADPVRGTEADSVIGGGNTLSGAAFSDPHEDEAGDTGEVSPDTTGRGTTAGMLGSQALAHEQADTAPETDEAAEEGNHTEAGTSDGETDERTILEGTRAIFSRTHKPSPEYVDSVYAENFPSFVVIGGTADVPELDEFNYTAPVLVTAESYARIAERAKHIVEIPHAFEGDMEPEELGVIQKWFEGVVYEMNEDENATYIGLSERTLKRVTGDMRQYLGVPNQAGAVYSMLLHGHEQGQVHQYETPPMESTQKFHLLLTGMGFTEQQAAGLATVDHSNPVSVSRVKRYRQDAYSELHAEQSGYALVNAFRSGIFTPISR